MTFTDQFGVTVTGTPEIGWTRGGMGKGGQGGSNGTAVLINRITKTASYNLGSTTAGTVPAVPVTITGSAGGAGVSAQFNL
jgi:hypothetical protein